jgi:pyruvate formate lyase activating enzyme
VLLDIKTWDAERHIALTGMDNGPTLAFARRLAARRRPVWLRYVLVPGLTDDPSDIAEIARFAAGLGNVERVDVLPFHQLGKYKWAKLQLPYSLPDTESPDVLGVQRTLDAFRGEGLTAY